MYEVKINSIRNCTCTCEDKDALCDFLEGWTGLYSVGLAAVEWADTALPGDRWQDHDNGVSVYYPPFLCEEV